MSTTGLLLVFHTLSLQVYAALLDFNDQLCHDLLVLLVLPELPRHPLRLLPPCQHIRVR